MKLSKLIAESLRFNGEPISKHAEALVEKVIEQAKNATQHSVEPTCPNCGSIRNGHYLGCEYGKAQK
jgi:hypothetical protein